MKKMEGLEVEWGEAPRMVVLWGQLREDSDHKCVTSRSDLCHSQEFTAFSAMQPKHCLLRNKKLSSVPISWEPKSMLTKSCSIRAETIFRSYLDRETE